MGLRAAPPTDVVSVLATLSMDSCTRGVVPIFQYSNESRLFNSGATSVLIGAAIKTTQVQYMHRSV